MSTSIRSRSITPVRASVWNHLKAPAVSPSNPPNTTDKASAANFNTSFGWIPVLGTVYNGMNLVVDFLGFMLAVLNSDSATMADELGYMTIDVIGMIPIVGGPIAGSLYWTLHPVATPASTCAI